MQTAFACLEGYKYMAVSGQDYEVSKASLRQQINSKRLARRLRGKDDMGKEQVGT